MIFKGVNSNTITGLIICEEPPITKPKMRVSIDEIDGVDGSIITELGYESYTKTISIGLKGTYDINSVISFFNGSGTLTFDNESDKYYNAKIIEQIDYERLLRFRTANVKFYCQPFKYKIGESFSQNITTETSISVTNSGNVASKPIITITGSGNIVLSLNGHTIMTIVLGENTHITLDSETQDAYIDGVLKNRLCTGDFVELLAGENTINWTGTITKIEIEKQSRWI